MNRVKELFHLSAIIGGLFALSYHLAHAQAMPSSPHNDNQKIIYMRGDTVFQVESDGVEVALLPVSVDEEMRRGRIIVEIDTLINRIVYRPGPGHVSISNLYGDSLWVTDSIFVTVHRLNAGRSTSKYPIYFWNADSQKFENVSSAWVSLDTTDWIKYGWVTDSIKWVAADTLFEGDSACKHDWVYDEAKPGSVQIHKIFGMELLGCLRINPDGKHCNEHQSATREKICRKCLRGEIEREKWFQHFVAPPKSEFERLKEKQTEKQ